MTVVSPVRLELTSWDDNLEQSKELMENIRGSVRQLQTSLWEQQKLLGSMVQRQFEHEERETKRLRFNTPA